MVATMKEKEDWRGVCRDFRTVYISYGLDNVSIEIGDERGLKPVQSFAVDANESIYHAWPILKRKVMVILGTRLWLALLLLAAWQRRFSRGDLHNDRVYDRSVPGLKESTRSDRGKCQHVAGEIGRDSMPSDDAYQTEARMGPSIGPRRNRESAGTFTCYLRRRASEKETLQVFGLTCHHVLLPSSSSYLSKDGCDKSGTPPGEANELEMDMPSQLDHLHTMEILNPLFKSRTRKNRNWSEERFRTPRALFLHIRG